MNASLSSFVLTNALAVIVICTHNTGMHNEQKNISYLSGHLIFTENRDGYVIIRRVDYDEAALMHLL